MKLQATLALSILALHYGLADDYNYLVQPVVKLLAVTSASDRYPVTDSQYRESVTNGQDEDAGITEDEALNGFQPMKLRLNPGGCATYTFPAFQNQTYIYLVPSRNDGDNPFEVFCDKGSVTVTATSDDGKRYADFECFGDSSCSPSPCSGDIVDIHSGVSGTEPVHLEICTDAASSYPAFLWELDISHSYNPTKVYGAYNDEGRHRIDSTQNDPDFNTQLSMISVVGMRGVGKSTIISLLSGNDTMFNVGSGSTGTTTIGADVSPIIPAQDWTPTLSQQIDRTITMPSQNWPIFILDSEGMGVRPGDFDFMTTSSPAIISKEIIWVDEAPVDTTNILTSIGNYLDGLDGITFSDDGSGSGVFCASPVYGFFLIIINKLTDDTSDEQLENTILYPVPGEDELNIVRQRIYECFEGTKVVGCPRETVPPEESFGYSVLSDRFKDELAIIAETIIERLDDSRIVTINDMALPYNSTDASWILDFIITQANLGIVDLNQNPILVQAEQEVTTYLQETSGELNSMMSDNCDKLHKDYICSACACSYRNVEVSAAVVEADYILSQANEDSLSVFGEDISQQIEEFKNTTVFEWALSNGCYQHRPEGYYVSGQHMCDITEMSSVLSAPGTVIIINCTELMLCESATFDAKSLIFIASSLYIEAGATFENLPPSSLDGSDGAAPGEAGSDGAAGATGPSISIEASMLLKSSHDELIFRARGGDGGKGGNGAGGENHMDLVTQGPQNAEEVTNQGTEVDNHHYCHDPYCDFFEWNCKVCGDYYYYELKDNTNACGGNGGNAGDGGDAGVPGSLTFYGHHVAGAVTANIVPLKSYGGLAGIPGTGADGLSVNKVYYGTKHWYEHIDSCDGWFGSCDKSHRTEYMDYSYTDNSEDCPGDNGDPGLDGTDWDPPTK